MAEKLQNSTTIAAGVGAATTIVLWAVHEATGRTLPVEVATAITTVLMALVTHLVPDAKDNAPAKA